MAWLEISDGLYQQLEQQADHVGLSLEDWLAITSAPELQELYTWFFGLLEHDLRAPLAAIVTSSEILKYYQTRLTEERRVEHLDSIQSQVYLLAGLLSNVRMLQQVAQGTLCCDPAARDLGEFVETVCRELRGMTGNSHEVIITVADDLMPFRFDDRLLRLTLLNVLLNAVQYSPNATHIDLTLAVTPQQARLTVTDYGIGIPVAELAHVFELRYRASNVPDNLGQGLGLTVAQRVMALHGGSIDLTSTIGEGTTVSISLPA